MKKTLLLPVSLALNGVLAICVAFAILAPATDRKSPAINLPISQAQPTAPAPLPIDQPTSETVPVPPSEPTFTANAAPARPIPAAISSTGSPAAIASSASRPPSDSRVTAAPAGVSPNARPSREGGDSSDGPVTAVNPAAPGNTFSFRGVRVAVAESFPTAGGTALGVNLTPDSGANDTRESQTTPSDASIVQENSGSGSPATVNAPTAANTGYPADIRSPNSPNGPKTASGFTDEEELFRLKWGWEAFDAAQREAVREAGQAKQN